MKSLSPQVIVGKYAVKRVDKDEKAETKQKNQLKKLKTIVNESHFVLAHAQAVFPFNFFPDSITIDRHKLTITYRQFFFNQQIVSVPIENVKNIQAECGPVFGSVTITSDHFVNNTQEVHYLWKSDAQKIQRIVQGAMVAHAEEIDVSKINSKELVKLLSDLGKGETPDKTYSTAA